MNIEKLLIYPIKSLSGIELDSSMTEEEGLGFDRRMFLIDKNGRFLSQRELTKMALIGAEIHQDYFCFYDKRNKEDFIHIPFDLSSQEKADATVWNHRFQVDVLAARFSCWFEDFLSTSLSLVKLHPQSNRKKSLIKSPGTVRLSAADGYPYLILSNQSLNDLNNRLDVPLGMDRFRPNIVVNLDYAYQEEDVHDLMIGEVKFRMIKPCARCMMTTINQKTTEKLVEPLKTLSTYKKKGNKIYFGMNAIALNSGKININDTIQILA